MHRRPPSPDHRRRRRFPSGPPPHLCPPSAGALRFRRGAGCPVPWNAPRPLSCPGEPCDPSSSRPCGSDRGGSTFLGQGRVSTFRPLSAPASASHLRELPLRCALCGCRTTRRSRGRSNLNVIVLIFRAGPVPWKSLPSGMPKHDRHLTPYRKRDTLAAARNARAALYNHAPPHAFCPA